MTTRVCIADPLSVFRAAVRQVLVREQDFEVVEAATVEDFDARLAEGFDVALVDDELSPDGTLAAVRLAKGRCDHIVVWSLRPSPERVLDAIRAGATGYLRKEISPAGLVRSLRAVAKGESPLSRDLASLMISAMHDAEARSRAHEITATLSERERQVLDHLVRGSRNKQIADALTISEFTVKRHVQNILQKLELPSRRAAATLYASVRPDVGSGAAV